MSKISDQPRLWRSPGEKKIIEPATQAKDASNPELERTKKPKDNKDKKRSKPKETEHLATLTTKCSASLSIDSRAQLTTSTGLLQVLSVSTFPSLNDPKQSELPSSSGDPVLNRMKEIDLKLMEYQQQKMSIDEIILKYQKEKMSIEQMTMQLQNERFQLLSSMLANSNNANTHLLASGLSSMRPQDPLSIVVPNPEVPSVIDLTKAEHSNAGKTMKIKHKKTISKKRSLEMEHKDVEHRSKKSKLSPKESSHNKHSKSRKSSETSNKWAATLNEPLRGHSERSKQNETYVDLTIDERTTVKTSAVVNSFQSNSRLDAAPESLSMKKYRHLITKDCCIKLKRFKRDELNMILSSPIRSESPHKDKVISESDSESIEPDTTADTKLQPKPYDKITESDFLGFLTPTTNFDGRFVGHRMPIVFMQVSFFLNFCMKLILKKGWRKSCQKKTKIVPEICSEILGFTSLN